MLVVKASYAFPETDPTLGGQYGYCRDNPIGWVEEREDALVFHGWHPFPVGYTLELPRDINAVHGQVCQEFNRVRGVNASIRTASDNRYEERKNV